MKLGVDYAHSYEQMGDLLMLHGVSIKRDFSEEERLQLRNILENYLKSASKKYLILDMKTFYLGLCGVDEVGHLYPYVV